jgi:hypothetical protein
VGSSVAGAPWPGLGITFQIRETAVAILELLYRGFTRQAVPDFDQPGGGPVRRRLRKAGFIAKAFRVRHGFGVLNRRVDGDVVKRWL